MPTGTILAKQEWTVMFYFAGDNELSPLMISLLQDIKTAGRHQSVNVLVHFDPNAPGVPAHTFDVNRKRKFYATAEHSGNLFGDGNQPTYIWPLAHDKLWEDDAYIDVPNLSGTARRSIRDMVARHFDNFDYIPPSPPNSAPITEPKPQEALLNFLTFCKEHYPANNYMLFLVGHGMIVANDAFLKDENPRAGISLIQLRETLTKADLGNSLQLIGFHSCSMSALEVAYEIQGQAKYMLASEGPAFLGSWPYRKILMSLIEKLIRNADTTNPSLIDEIVKGAFNRSFYNSLDFQMAGYSFDLSWCDLSKISDIKSPLQGLTKLLCACLAKKAKETPDVVSENDRVGEIVTDLVLLSHWEAQSYWKEQYTDLYDFCNVLEERSQKAMRLFDMASPSPDQMPEANVENASSTVANALLNLVLWCKAVREALKPSSNGIVRRSDNCGPTYQYSHGLSVYFPWSYPLTDYLERGGDAGTNGNRLARYSRYKFTTEFSTSTGNKSWLDFLNLYLEKTMREERYYREPTNPDLVGVHDLDGSGEPPRLKDLDFADLASVLLSNANGQLSGDKPSGGVGEKPSGGTGDVSCSCPSIKNYPTRTGRSGGRSRQVKVRYATPSPGQKTALDREEKHPSPASPPAEATSPAAPEPIS